MRNLIVHITTGYCGEEVHDILQVEDDSSEKFIEAECWLMACEHAEAYGHYEDEEGEGLENLGYEYFDYVPEEHDMYRQGGGTFQNEFD